MSRRKFVEKKHNSHRLAPSRYPGVFIMKEAGILVRARVRDPWKPKIPGKKWAAMTTIKRVFYDKTEAEASAWLTEARKQIRSRPSVSKQELLFSDYAVSVLEERAKLHELSADKLKDWKTHLVHLIQGTEGREGRRVQGFGDRLVTEITAVQIDEWKKGVSFLIAQGDYKPGTANGWLSTLKVILARAKRKYGGKHDPMEGVSLFPLKGHSTYSFEEPNSLTLQQLPEFLRVMRELFPQHYALTKFGFVTGIRCVNLSPLRRSPDETGAQDIFWQGEKRGLCYIRRGYGREKEMSPTTKNRSVYPITIPDSLLEDLKWHVETQLPKGQESSIYLFPSETGEPRQGQVLTTPFAVVSKAIGLDYKLSLRGMRRTFHALMDAAGVDGSITRSITGHRTAKMTEHYTFKDAQKHLHAIGAAMDMVDGRWSTKKAA